MMFIGNFGCFRATRINNNKLTTTRLHTLHTLSEIRHGPDRSVRGHRISADDNNHLTAINVRNRIHGVVAIDPFLRVFQNAGVCVCLLPDTHVAATPGTITVGLFARVECKVGQVLGEYLGALHVMPPLVVAVPWLFHVRLPINAMPCAVVNV